MSGYITEVQLTFILIHWGLVSLYSGILYSIDLGNGLILTAS